MTISNPIAPDTRALSLHQWASDVLSNPNCQIKLLSGDASFRRYFRIHSGDHTFVAMDAPPHLENCAPFVAISNAFAHSDIALPKVLAWQKEQGFLLLSDFGDLQLLPALNTESADSLYTTAMDILLQLQNCKTIPDYALPHFDDAQWWREFEIFDTWYLKKNLGKKEIDETALKNIYQLIIDSANQQPTVFVHRDYHSRNIMLCNNTMGILDFQDALTGPVTYDLVSLLKDCYIAWPEEQVKKWALYFYEKWIKQRPQENITADTFLRWFDWMGLQRHIKCLGIFSRLYFRDNKSGYLKEIPRVQQYALSVCERYPELAGLSAFLM